jgi:hypothetical protein
MKKMPWRITLIMSLFVVPASGAVMATNIVLKQVGGELASFTVPTGKVLVVEHVYNSSVDEVVAWINPSTAIPVSKSGYMLSWVPSLKLTAGTVLRGECAVVFGLLVDPEDLYASITSEFSSLYASNEHLKGTLRLGSPQPSVVAIQRRNTLDSGLWEKETSASIKATATKTVSDFTIPLPPADSQFYRATARAHRHIQVRGD